ncbi:hypothetical protein EON66_10690 [archaeon]|nr:MAG: hypothetical protein EON66_10690 [archaeon]
MAPCAAARVRGRGYTSSFRQRCNQPCTRPVQLLFILFSLQLPEWMQCPGSLLHMEALRSDMAVRVRMLQQTQDGLRAALEADPADTDYAQALVRTCTTAHACATMHESRRTRTRARTQARMRARVCDFKKTTAGGRRAECSWSSSRDLCCDGRQCTAHGVIAGNQKRRTRRCVQHASAGSSTAAQCTNRQPAGKYALLLRTTRLVHTNL